MNASKAVKNLAHANKPAIKQTSLISTIVLLGLLVSLLSACTPSATPTAAPEAATTVESASAPAAAEAATQPATDVAAPAADASVITLKIGVSPVPHGDIIKFINENLAKEAGLNLDIVEFTDYVQPNLALNDGQLDANYFQHIPYLEDFSKEHKLELVPVVAVHIEPLGLYSKKVKSLAEIQDKAVVAIPNDATNGGRALNLLAANGLLKLNDGVGTAATVKDIAENPKNLDIKEVEAAQLVRTLDDVTAAVINGNYAIEAGLKPAKDALALESGENNPYANILTVKKGHEKDEGIQKLAKLLTSPEVKKFIEEKYEGSVIPAFKDFTAATEAAVPAAEIKEITLKVGVSPVPHGDILKFINEKLAGDAGLKLDIVEFTDYVQPNLALNDGQLDANYFQHKPYLDDFSKEHKLDLVSVAAVHIEPLGLYSKKVKSVTEITDKAVIAIPNDATNGGRALNLLATNGLLKLKEGVGTAATVNDIVENPKNLDIKEVEAAQLVRTLDDVAAAVINGNYAIEAGLKPAKDALALESGENNPYANLLVVKKGHENDEGIQRLAKLLTSPEVKKFIEEKYEGSVIPAFQ